MWLEEYQKELMQAYHDYNLARKVVANIEKVPYIFVRASIESWYGLENNALWSYIYALQKGD